MRGIPPVCVDEAKASLLAEVCADFGYGDDRRIARKNRSVHSEYVLGVRTSMYSKTYSFNDGLSFKV